MGKRLITIRRGKGSPRYKCHRKGANTDYYSYEELKEKEAIKGEIVDFIKESGRNTIIAKTLWENGKTTYILAPEGIFIGEQITLGKSNEIKIGNILPLENIPEGCPIFNIESIPGDGGKMIKGSGEYALIMGKEPSYCLVRLPSGKTRKFLQNCRATIGCVAGGGRTEKPFIKAGNRYHAMKAKSKLVSIVRGVAKNASDHPHGGSQHHVGRSKSVSRHAPPGRKVGNIASKRTGRIKKV